MVWCHQATRHYLNQYWPRSMLTLGHTELTNETPSLALSHHQCWLTISEAQWHLPEGSFPRGASSVNPNSPWNGGVWCQPWKFAWNCIKFHSNFQEASDKVHTLFPEMKFKDFSRTYQGQNYIFQALSHHYLVLWRCFILWWNNLPYTKLQYLLCGKHRSPDQ